MKKKFSLLPFFTLIVCLCFCCSDHFKRTSRAKALQSESGIYIDGGLCTFDGGTISGKVSTSGFGGGVYVSNATFNMKSGEISNNTPFGIYGSGANIIIDDGNISNNAMYGIYYEHETILTLNGGAVFGHTMGLVSMDSSAIMNNCNIVNNSQMGVYITDCTFDMHGGKIHNNGCGFAMSGGDVTMKNGEISDNVDKSMGYGVLIYEGNFTMDGGKVSNNGVANGVGGGVHLVDGSFTMNSGTIEGNTSEHCGGGVYVLNGTFTMVNGLITGNTAFANDDTMGGGVYVGNGTFIMKGGEISGNNATQGDAIYVDGTFEYAGGVINGKIALGSPFANMIISGEPESVLELFFHEGDLEYNNGKIAKFVGEESIDLSKIQISSHYNEDIQIVEIDGEKWIVDENIYEVVNVIHIDKVGKVVFRQQLKQRRDDRGEEYCIENKKLVIKTEKKNKKAA